MSLVILAQCVYKPYFSFLFSVSWDHSKCRMLVQALQRVTSTMRIVTTHWTLSTITATHRHCLSMMTRPLSVWNNRTHNTQTFLRPALPSVTQTESYKVQASLRKRCPKCYFVRRQGRLFVECKEKPRHKQMQKMSKRKLFRED